MNLETVFQGLKHRPLTSLAHATSDYSCRAILLGQRGFVYQLSAKEVLGVPSSKNPENHC